MVRDEEIRLSHLSKGLARERMREYTLLAFERATDRLLAVGHVEPERWSPRCFARIAVVRGDRESLPTAHSLFRHLLPDDQHVEQQSSSTNVQCFNLLPMFIFYCHRRVHHPNIAQQEI